MANGAPKLMYCLSCHIMSYLSICLTRCLSMLIVCLLLFTCWSTLVLAHSLRQFQFLQCCVSRHERLGSMNEGRPPTPSIDRGLS